MPMPRWWGHVNKRVFNPRAISSGKWPVLTHVGRTSGTTYRTPLDAYPVKGGYVFILVYGRSEERRVGKECVSSVDLGGRRIIKKKNKTKRNNRIDNTIIRRRK